MPNHLGQAETDGILVVERPVGARLFKEGKGIMMRSDDVRTGSEHMFDP
jgi:hypothetical protein